MLKQLITKQDMTYRRLEEYLQSFKFRHHFMLSKEQVPTALLPGEVSMVPIALCTLCEWGPVQHARSKKE
jgi:hypothetical protein